MYMRKCMEKERVVLVGLNLGQNRDFERSMKEMEALAEANEMTVEQTFTQMLPKMNAGYYIGSGKISEIRAYIEEEGVETVLFDNQLSPIQLRNLADALDAAVIDRTNLILKIFARRAQTREATLQVAYAAHQYALPRLVGMHRELGRQAGTSGSLSSRGAGETKIELDRRRIEHRMAELRKELDEVASERLTQRKKRLLSPYVRAALVGYTNAGKSTIMNQMLAFSSPEEKKVYEEDMLFATLDTQIRRIEPGNDRLPFLLSDTVGFISNLPTALVRAFRSTLEESRYADLLLIVSDLSDPDYRDHLEVTMKTLEEIGAGDIPRIYIFNKADKLDSKRAELISVPGADEKDRRITMSAKNPEDISRLFDLIDEMTNERRVECDLLIPYTKGGILNALMESSDLKILNYTETGTLVHAFLKEEDEKRYRQYRIS